MMHITYGKSPEHTITLPLNTGRYTKLLNLVEYETSSCQNDMQVLQIITSFENKCRVKPVLRGHL